MEALFVQYDWVISVLFFIFGVIRWFLEKWSMAMARPPGPSQRRVIQSEFNWARVLTVALLIGAGVWWVLHFGIKFGDRIIFYPMNAQSVTLQCINDRIVDWKDLRANNLTRLSKKDALKSARAFCECKTEAMFLSGIVPMGNFPGSSRKIDRTSDFSILMRLWQRSTGGMRAVNQCVRSAFPRKIESRFK